MRFFLRFFPKSALWSEILRREGFSIVDTLENTTIWQEVFHKTPTLKDWLRKRELNLLKSVALQNQDTQFILGQIAENRLYQRFDIPPSGRIVESEKVEPVIPEKNKFLKAWNKSHANKEKSGEVNSESYRQGIEEKSS